MSLEESAPAEPAATPASPSPDPTGGAAGDPDPLAGDPAPDTAGADGSDQGNAVTGTQVGRDLSLSNTVYQGDFYQMMVEQRRTVVRQFTFTDGRVATEIEEQWAVEHFEGMEAEADALLRHLEQHRVMLLSAEAGARKVTAATHLAQQLRKRGGCTQPPLLFDSVHRHVRMDVRQFPVKHPQLKDQVVIFRYALSRGNLDLADAFATTDQAGWTQLADWLRARNAYLVFTATPGETEQFRGVPALRGVHRELAPHSPEVLGRRLDRYLGTLQERGGAAEALEALRGFREQLVKRFAFAPQLADFVDFFVGLSQPSLGLDEVFALFEDARKRLLHDLDEDFDGWSFGFTLALAQCTPDACGVPWVDFDRLRRHLRRWLRRDLQLAGGRDGEEDAEPSEVRLELSDDSLLTRSRARVEKDPITLADVIRFCDGRPTQGLWRNLLTRHRRVLTAIIPRLRELAERPDQDGSSMSVLAAQIIGRIGEIDYERVVVPMAERWASLARGRHRGLIGAMYEGVLGSDEPRFRARCLQHLRSMHTGGIAGRGKDRLDAAIGVYSWVGYYDFPLAMRELYAIVRAHLVPMIEDAARMSRLVTRIQDDIKRAAGGSDEAAARAVEEVLRDLVDRIYAQRAGTFLGVQFALASLCGTHGVAPVLREMRDWIARGGASTGVLVALMFMNERGIANQLREDRTEFPRGEGMPPVACGQFVRALANGEEDVHQAVRFLGDLYESVKWPWAAEALVRRHFRERLEEHLLEWVEEALPLPELAGPVRTLVEQLSRTHQGKLHEVVVHRVNSGEFRRTPELREFRASLRL
ncbi:MAG: hypothetical protein ACJ8GN_26840 [Longimicrobiaceae bacterium]